MAEEEAAAEVAAPSETGEVEGASWTDGMTEESAGFVQNKGWKSADQALESYRSLETAMRAPADQLLRLPKEEDSEGWGEVYSRLGRPEDPSGYKFNDSGMEDGGFGLKDNLRNWAHEAGMSQQQTSQIFDKYNERILEMGDEMNAQRQEQAASEEQALRKEWGSAWEENVTAGTRFRQRFGIDDATRAKLEQALGFRGLLELSAKIGRGLGEHSMPTGAEDSAGTAFGVTPAAAKAKIGDLTLDKEFMDQYLAGNPEAVARMTRLHALAHPEVAGSE